MPQRNKIQQEQKERSNTIGIKNYFDEIYTVVNDYMQEKMEDEREISDVSIENTKHFIKLLYEKLYNKLLYCS